MGSQRILSQAAFFCFSVESPVSQEMHKGSLKHSKSLEWKDKKKLKRGAASLWKLFDTLSRSVTHKLHISAGTVHGFMAVLLFCFYVCTRLISHPTTSINQEGKFLWSHCNKDSPVISFMDICGARRCGHSRLEWKWNELVLSKHPNSV